MVARSSRLPFDLTSRRWPRIQEMEPIMSRIALVIAFVLALIGPSSAQKAEIEAANAKWIEFFNKGDFAGIASFYTTDAIALPPGSAMMQGREAIAAMWKSTAEQCDPKLTTVDVNRWAPPRHARSGHSA
jgi:hypothetical protein